MGNVKIYTIIRYIISIICICEEISFYYKYLNKLYYKNIKNVSTVLNVLSWHKETIFIIYVPL